MAKKTKTSKKIKAEVVITAKSLRAAIHQPKPKNRKPDPKGVTVMTSAGSTEGDEHHQNYLDKKKAAHTW